MSIPPIFKVNEDVTWGVYGPIEDVSGFSERIIEFVEDNLDGNDVETVLCYLMESDGTVLTATLYRDAYVQSLETCLKYYSGEEQYEKCKEIKNLIKKI